MNSGYPITLRLAHKRCVVIGGGTVATRKVKSLVAAGAAVTVIAPEMTEELQTLAATGIIDSKPREALPADIRDALLVVVAADQSNINERIGCAAQDAGQLVNVVDHPELCNFFVPATVRRGPVSIAVSTDGASPMLARRIRQQLEHLIGPEYGELAELLGRLRVELKRHCDDQVTRASVWKAILDSPVLDLLREGKRTEAEATARSYFPEPQRDAGKDDA